MAIAGRFLRFLLVGGFATGVHYAVLVSAVRLLGWDPVPAAAAGFIVGAVVNYLLNRSFTFGSDAPHAVAVPRFASIAFAGLLLTVALVHVGTDVFGWHYLVAQALATGVVLLWNFVGNAFWTFRGGSAGGKMPRGE